MYASMLLLVSLSASQVDATTPVYDGTFQPVAAATESYRPYESAPAPTTAGGSAAGYSGTNYSGIDPWSAPTGTDWVGSGATCDGCDSWWGRCFGGCQRCCSCCSTCDLYPHYPYFPEYHGYYYFRPYNYVHIFEHQAIVARWGGDPRNPYSHELFTRLYENLPVEAPSPFVPGLRGIRDGLPDLEDLVPKKADVPLPPAPGGEE